MAFETSQIDYSWVIRAIVTILVYIIGSYIHIKIIAICNKVKDKTWQLDIANSIALMISFFFIITFETISDQITTLSDYTGISICYFAAFIYTYASYLGAFHSFCIALVKYLHIVQRDWVNAIGERRFKKMFALTYILHPLMLTIPTVMFYDFEGFPSLIKCFGLQQQLQERYNTSSGNYERMFFCKLSLSEIENESLFYNFKQWFCASKMIWVLVLACNLPEGFLYLKIFKNCRR